MTGLQVDDYADGVAALLERFGVALISPGAGAPVEVLVEDDGSLSFELVGSLPDARTPARSTVAVRELFRTIGQGQYERSDYEYELIDRERSFRRAFHLHDPEWFQRRFLVVVHEHCEQPLGEPACDHVQGDPIRDGFAGVVALMDAWTDDADCHGRRCLD